MADNTSMSVEETLAACRRLDGGDAGASAVSMNQEAGPESAAAPQPVEIKPESSTEPSVGVASSTKGMSVAEILAAARREKSGESQSAPAPKVSSASPQATPAAGKPGEMSVADILAAARGKKTAAPAPAKPVAKAEAAAKPKPVAKESVSKGPSSPAALDTQSILSAARKSGKLGPMSKEEAKSKGVVTERGGKTAVAEKAAKPVKQKLEAPPMPDKPMYARRGDQMAATPAEQTRRSFFSSAVGVFFGSSLAVGFTMLTLTNVLWLLGLARFMFPNILTEPPTRFKVGFPDDFAPGQVETKFIPQFGVWIVRYQYEGQPQIFALKSVCTHLGCTPNWLDAEQKFKCPCHGSGFYKDGINFEGPAPRPLERYAIRIADDGQLEVDKSQTFQEELGAWANPASFVPA